MEGKAHAYSLLVMCGWCYRSLSSLLTSHKLVKVQINGEADEERFRSLTDLLTRGSGGCLVDVKGKTLLFASGQSSKEELIQVRQSARPFCARQDRRL